MPDVFVESGAVVSLKSVLVVDNDAIVLKFLSRIIEKAGLEVRTADDGVSALDILETYTPDLFFIDLVMPNIDGQTLCRIIRSRDEFKKTPIVIISAIAAEEATDMTTLGANICIAKVGFADMAVLIEKILDDPLLLSDPELKDKVIGIGDLAPRSITSELLTINQHFRIMIDSISNGIITLNKDNRIIYANPSALNFFSMTTEMMVGNHFSRLFPDRVREQILPLMEDAASTGGSFIRHVTLPINDRIIDVSIVPSDVGKNSRVVILEDVTLGENARSALVDANEKLQVQAMLDGLTNVSNRRHFDELLHQEWGRMRREKGQLSLMFCDVDHFKDYNDTYGHLRGDQCLRDIAETIKANLHRPSDNVARYGGDEFVILLPGTTFEGACHLAEQILDCINRLQIAHESSPVADHVTLTIGVGSGFPGDEVPEDKFIWLADKALYEAKTKGRNCTVGEKWRKP